MMHDSPLALVALFPGSINTLQGSYNGRMMPESPGFGSLIPGSTCTLCFQDINKYTWTSTSLHLLIHNTWA